MILLHNQYDGKCRGFCEKYSDRFDKVLDYPECLKDFPNISHFPAVVIDIPEYIKDNSLWYFVKTLPNYRRLGMVAKDFQNINHSLGCGSGIPFLDGYIKDKGIKDEDKKYVVELCNDMEIPAPFLAWGIKYAYDLGEDCKDDLDEKNKERSVYPERPVLETIPESYEIIYPDTVEEVNAILNRYKDNIDLRATIYAGIV